MRCAQAISRMRFQGSCHEDTVLHRPLRGILAGMHIHWLDSCSSAVGGLLTRPPAHPPHEDLQDEQQADQQDNQQSIFPSLAGLRRNLSLQQPEVLVFSLNPTLNELWRPAGREERVPRQGGEGLCRALLAGAAQGQARGERVLLPSQALDPHLVRTHQGTCWAPRTSRVPSLS